MQNVTFSEQGGPLTNGSTFGSGSSSGGNGSNGSSSSTSGVAKTRGEMFDPLGLLCVTLIFGIAIIGL